MQNLGFQNVKKKGSKLKQLILHDMSSLTTKNVLKLKHVRYIQWTTAVKAPAEKQNALTQTRLTKNTPVHLFISSSFPPNRVHYKVTVPSTRKRIHYFIWKAGEIMNVDTILSDPSHNLAKLRFLFYATLINTAAFTKTIRWYCIWLKAR